MKTRPVPYACLMALPMLATLSLVPQPAMADPPATPPSSAPPAFPSPPAPPPAPPGGPLVLPPPPPSTVSRKAVALGAAGVAAAGAIGAIVVGVLALHEKTAYESNPTYANTDKGNNFAAYADGCIALAAAAGITSLVLLTTTPDVVDTGTAVPPKPSAAFLVAPVVTAHGGGAGAVLRF